jgi:DNA topoisomerase-3
VARKTKPKPLLSESDLISLMDTHGIGTDATIHSHIKTVLERGYAIQENKRFKVTRLGMAIIDAY